MSIKERLLDTGRLKEKGELQEDNLGEEVNLFEKYEFKVFMQFAKVYTDPDKVLACLHFISDNGIEDPVISVPAGRTPMEIAYYLYTKVMGKGYDEQLFLHFEALYDSWIKHFMPITVYEVPDDHLQASE